MSETTQAEMVASELAEEILQSISDSEPDEDTVEAQDRLTGTPLEHLYCLNGEVIMDHAERVIANALHEGPLALRGAVRDLSAALPPLGMAGENRFEDCRVFPCYATTGERVAVNTRADALCLIASGGMLNLFLILWLLGVVPFLAASASTMLGFGGYMFTKQAHLREEAGWKT